jgi:pyruvate ferredoxin oxidoreductase gamma subunit
MLEIRWHSRAGQGAKTGGNVLSQVMALGGKYVQDFSVYGAEKRGAPMNAFNRVADEKIIDHSKTMDPDFVMVIDPSLAYGSDVLYSTKPTTKFIITTHLDKEAFLKEIPQFVGKDLYLVDCITISKETIGRVIPNTPMLGALMKVSGILPIEEFKEATRKMLTKFPQKVIDGNMNAIQRAHDEVN